MITTYAGNTNGLAGYGGDGGPPTAARLYGPTGLFVDGPGNLYIADVGNNVVRIVYAGAGGTIATVAGNAILGAGYSGDGGQATAGMLNEPMAVTVDAGGNLFIAEYGDNIIREVNVWGTLSTIAGSDTAIGYRGDGGPATAASLAGPSGLAFDAYGNLFIADKFNSVIRKISGIGSVGVAQVAAPDNNISLFPNPNDGTFSISGYLNTPAGQKVSIEVTDMLGRQVYANNVAANNGEVKAAISLGRIPGGMYMLHMRSETADKVLPFVVGK